MSRAIEQDEAIAKAPELVRTAGQDTVLIQRKGKTVAAIVSPDEYESTQEARAQRAIDAMMAFRAHMHSVATPEELQELERELDTDAA